MPTLRLIGPGRAGLSVLGALEQRGWTCLGTLGRGDDISGAARGVDLVVVATPDDAIAATASAIEPVDTTIVIHLSGSCTLEVLQPHPRRGSVHPLASLPDPRVGVRRLLEGCPLAVAGDRAVVALAESIGGPVFEVPDAVRSLYHATACVAANHLVALSAQVERLADLCAVPAAMFWELMAGALDNVRDVGAAAALTGPAARGDIATIDAHLDAMPEPEHQLYLTLAQAAAALAGTELDVSPSPGPPRTDP